MRASHVLLSSAALATLLVSPAAATFHLMQIEQVIGGVGGSGAQAIQLRMRSIGQNLVSNARLVVRDASGSNPVVLIAFPTNVANASTGNRVLAATSDFSGATASGLTPDFILDNPIPASYLAAGTLTYEDNFGDILWRLSWGGANYTGPGTGGLTNDADGNFSPPFAGPLPSTTSQALRFIFGATALSTNNANDYAVTTGAALFTNNAGDTGSVMTPAAVGEDPSVRSVALGRPSPNPVGGSMSYSIFLPRESQVHLSVLDLQGRTVLSIANQTMAAGRHVLDWSTRTRESAALPAGMYFLRLDADGIKRVQRFVLMR